MIKNMPFFYLCIVLFIAMITIGCAKPTPTAAPTPATVPKTTTTTPTTTATSKPTPTATVKPIILKTVNGVGPTHVVRLQMESMMDMVKKRSGGRIDFEYFAGSSLYNVEQSTDAVGKNMVQLAQIRSAYFIQRFGLAGEISSLPFNFPSFEGYTAHLRDKGGFFDWVAPYFEKANTKLLSAPVLPPNGISSKKPIRNMQDLKGVLIGSPTGPSATAWKLLGAEPVFISPGDVYEALMRGTIDARNYAISGTLSDKLYEVAKYYTVCEWSIVGAEIAMNLDSFNSLPPDLQKIIQDAALETEQSTHKGLYATTNKEIDQLKANGVQFIYLDKDERARWVAGVQPIYDDIAKKYGEDWNKFIKIRDTMIVK